MNTATNTRGVSEAMVEREVVLSVLRNLKCPHDGKNGDVYEKAAAHVWGDAIITAMKAVQSLAALSAPEPAAQGEALSFKERVALEVGADEASEDDILSHVAAWVKAAKSAPPTQPAERVPEAVVVPYGSESGEKDYAYGYEKGRADGWNACRDAMLTASPAPLACARGWG